MPGLKSLLLIAVVAPLFAQTASQKFTVVENTIPAMRTAMEKKQITSRELVTQYLTRIALYEDKLHAAIMVNPNALQEADDRDRERANRGEDGCASHFHQLLLVPIRRTGWLSRRWMM